MTRRLAAVLALVVLLFGAASYAIASTSGPQPVACTLDGGTLSCPVPQATVTETTTASTTETVVAEPVTVLATATETTTVVPAAVTAPGTTVTVTKTATKTVTATSTPRSTTGTPTPTPAAASSTAPAGTTKPGASNTGVPAGTTLTASAGITASTAGQVIDGKDVTGGINVTAANVTIKNSRVKGSGSGQCINVTGSGSVTILDSEIVGGCENGVGFDNWKAYRLNLHGTFGDGVKLGSNVTLQDSWVHGLTPAAGAHADGGQLQGGVTNLTVRHNVITVADTAGGNAALFMAPDLGPSAAGPVLVDGNWLDGGNFTVQFVDGNNGQYHQGGTTFTANRFGASHSYGYSNVNEPITQSGNVVDATGAPLTL